MIISKGAGCCYPLAEGLGTPYALDSINEALKVRGVGPVETDMGENMLQNGAAVGRQFQTERKRVETIMITLKAIRWKPVLSHLRKGISCTEEEWWKVNFQGTSMVAGGNAW